MDGTGPMEKKCASAEYFVYNDLPVVESCVCIWCCRMFVEKNMSNHRSDVCFCRLSWKAKCQKWLAKLVIWYPSKCATNLHAGIQLAQSLHRQSHLGNVRLVIDGPSTKSNIPIRWDSECNEFQARNHLPSKMFASHPLWLFAVLRFYCRGCRSFGSKYSIISLIRNVVSTSWTIHPSSSNRHPASSAVPFARLQLRAVWAVFFFGLLLFCWPLVQSLSFASFSNVIKYLLIVFPNTILWLLWLLLYITGINRHFVQNPLSTLF